MAGAALSKLWDTNPKLACVLQSSLCVMVAGFLVSFLFASRREWTLIVILGVFLVIETGTLVWFTYDAVQDGWARSDW